MRSMKTSIAVSVCVIIVCCIAASAQQFKSAPLPVQRSPFTDQLKALRAANPKMPLADFVASANALLDKHGIGFAVSLDAATCERVKKVKEQLKDPSATVTLGATLKSVDADGASLTLPAPTFPSGDCGCYIELPMLQITENDFITVIAGRNIRFHRPAAFSSAEAVLLDAKDKTTIRRKWRVPFGSTPIGVSHDGNVLYLSFADPELIDLSLLVFGEGVFQIGTRAEAEDGGKGKLLETVATGGHRFINFERWGNSYLVRFAEPCR